MPRTAPDSGERYISPREEQTGRYDVDPATSRDVEILRRRANGERVDETGMTGWEQHEAARDLSGPGKAEFDEVRAKLAQRHPTGVERALADRREAAAREAGIQAAIDRLGAAERAARAPRAVPDLTAGEVADAAKLEAKGRPYPDAANTVEAARAALERIVEPERTDETGVDRKSA